MPQQNSAEQNGNHDTTHTSQGDYGEAFPKSKKVFVEGPHGVQVPMREISLAGGEPPLRVNDTSGPLGIDPHVGLPNLRAPWIDRRGGVIEGATTMR